MNSPLLSYTDRYVQSPKVLSSSIGDELFIFNPDNERYFHLNDSGSFIWKLLQTPQTAEQLMESIVTTYRISQQEAQQAVIDTLETLISKTLVLKDSHESISGTLDEALFRGE